MRGIGYRTEVQVLNKHKGPFTLLVLCGGKQEQGSKVPISKLIRSSTARWQMIECNTKSAPPPRLSQFSTPLCLTYSKKLLFFFFFAKFLQHLKGKNRAFVQTILCKGNTLADSMALLWINFRVREISSTWNGLSRKIKAVLFNKITTFSSV